MQKSKGNFQELSSSQAAKLFHLDPSEIAALEQVRDILLFQRERIFSRLLSQLSVLPGGAAILGGRHNSRRMADCWMEASLRPWDPKVREPRLKHLAVFAAKKDIPGGYITALLSCLEETCAEILRDNSANGNLSVEKAEELVKVLQKRIATEHLGLMSVYLRHLRQEGDARRHELEHMIETRSLRLRSTVSLSQAIAEEIDEEQVIRTLAQHVMDTFHPDYLAVNIVNSAEIVETPLVICENQLFQPADDPAMQALRKDWHLCRAARTGKVFYVPDIETSLVACAHMEWRQASGCYCCVPLTSGTQILGWMHLRRDKAVGFSEEEREVLNIYGQMVGTAITSLRLVLENRQQARTDPLTGLDNRRYFQATLAKEDLLLKRRGGMASVVMVDVDHFKEFNDRYGHETGDRVLTALAAALRQAIRCTDEVARLGGDEFILLLRDCGAENAVKVGQKILDRAEAASVRVDSATHVNLEISVGIASCPDHAKSLEEASLLADVALLRAKESGRNQVAIYNPDVDGQVLATRGYGRGLSR